MMRRYSILTAALLLLAVAMGLLLPAGVSWMQDVSSAQAVMDYAVDTVAIDCASYTLAEKLALCRSSSYAVETTAATCLSEQEAVQACQDFVFLLLPSLSEIMDATPCTYLVFFEYGTSLLIWNVLLYSENFGEINLVLDDASGAVLSFSIYPIEESMLNSLLVTEAQTVTSGLREEEFADAQDDYWFSCMAAFGDHLLCVLADSGELSGIEVQMEDAILDADYRFISMSLLLDDGVGHSALCPLRYDCGVVEFNR